MERLQGIITDFVKLKEVGIKQLEVQREANIGAEVFLGD